jgi:tetratricopeptide (TPR) repeat protein
MDKSLNEALEAFREQPNLIPAHIIAARIYEDRGNHSKAIEQTDFVLQAQPANPDARLIRDRALIATNQPNVAQPDLESLVKQYPKVTDAHLQLATLYLNQKDYAKASTEFQQVWSANPPDVRGFIGLQLIKLAQGQADDAVRSLQDLVQKNPNISGYRYQLANFEATAAGEYARSKPDRAKQLLQQAADNYQEVLKTNPKSTDVWVRLGLVQRELKDNDAALKSFQEAEKINPRDVGALGQEGMLLENMGNKQEAVNVYNRMLGIDPNNTLALNNLAFLNAESGKNLDQALSFAERAKQRVPDNPNVSDTLGYVYYKRDLNQEALRIFRQIVQDQPENPTFRLHLAMALLKEGDKQGAKTEAEKALKNASQPQQQSEIRSFVSQIG